MQKKLFLLPLLFLSATLVGKEEASPLSRDLEKIQQTGAISAAGAKNKQEEISDLLVLTPDARAQDYKQAFELIRKEKAAANVSFLLKDGTAITNILSMDVMSKGTLIIFKINTTKGISYVVTKVENIETLMHR